MQNQLGAEYPTPADRKRYLHDNCDSVEELAYMKPFDEEQLDLKKERLANVSIEINDLEFEKKKASDEFAATLKPLQIERKTILSDVKAKAEYVTEDCYVFLDHQTKRVGYYNANGDLVSERTMRPQEMQKTIFASIERTAIDRTGTND